MVTNVFVSFDHDDQDQIADFKLLKSNQNHPREFHDHLVFRFRNENQVDFLFPLLFTGCQL